MLALKDINKAFQTEEIETLALNNINIHIKKCAVEEYISKFKKI